MNAISRREALRLGGLAGVTALMAACTPTRILLHWYPTQYDADAGFVDRVLAAFVDAVVGDANHDPAEATRPFGDERFPLHKYRGFLAYDLDSRARRRFGNDRFAQLSREDRCAVIRDGLTADGTMRKLYAGAIYLTQVACYAGIYDDETGCPRIGFEGRFRVRGLAELTYPNPDAFLPREIGSGGNYA